MKKLTREEWYLKEFKLISKDIKNKNHLNLLDFFRIRNFKLNNITKEKKDNIIKITEEAFKKAKNDDIIGAVSELIKLDGVQLPIASTILAMRFPKKYAIIDKFVAKGISKEKEWTTKSKGLNIYKEYILKLRKKSKGAYLRELEWGYFQKGKLK